VLYLRFGPVNTYLRNQNPQPFSLNLGETMNPILSFLAITTALFIGCATTDDEPQQHYTPSSSSSEATTSSLTYGGKTYKTVKIGSQWWMAENLDYNGGGGKCYGEGTKVLIGVNADGVIYANIDYSEALDNCRKYGKLYTQSSAQSICPPEWHLPSESEWDKLINYVEMNKSCSECAGRYLKATSGWNNNLYDQTMNGFDTFGFAALPGGMRYGTEFFGGEGDFGHWWISDKRNTVLKTSASRLQSDEVGDNYMASVRCIKN